MCGRWMRVKGCVNEVESGGVMMGVGEGIGEGKRIYVVIGGKEEGGGRGEGGRRRRSGGIEGRGGDWEKGGVDWGDVGDLGWRG